MMIEDLIEEVFEDIEDVVEVDTYIEDTKLAEPEPNVDTRIRHEWIGALAEPQAFQYLTNALGLDPKRYVVCRGCGSIVRRETKDHYLYC